MEWTLQQLAIPRPALNVPRHGPGENIDTSKFKGMFEKIFYIKKVKERFFLVKGEAVPVRKAVSKRFIPQTHVLPCSWETKI